MNDLILGELIGLKHRGICSYGYELHTGSGMGDRDGCGYGDDIPSSGEGYITGRGKGDGNGDGSGTEYGCGDD